MSHCPTFPNSESLPQTRVATGRGELTAAFELVYRCYLAKGFVEPHPGRIIYQATFGLPSSRTLVTTDRSGAVVGTLTVAGDNPLGLQLETTFPDELRSLRAQDRRVAEITCLAIEATGELPSKTIFFSLSRFMIHYAYRQRYDDVLIGIHPRHYGFYRRCYPMQQMGPCRPHGVVRDNPAVCCRLDLHHLKRDGDPQLWQQYFAAGFPESEYRKPPILPADHRHFCRRRGVAPVVDGIGPSGWERDAA